MVELIIYLIIAYFVGSLVDVFFWGYIADFVFYITGISIHPFCKGFFLTLAFVIWLAGYILSFLKDGED